MALMFSQFYYPDTRIYRRILDFAARRQNGLCYGCRQLFEGNEIIVRGNSKVPRYYHLPCAKRFNIVDEYSIEAIMTEENPAKRQSRLF
jgi:hypothetical protein